MRLRTHKLYSNILIHLKKHNKQHKELSFRCKAMNFLLEYRLEITQNVINNFLLKYFFASKARPNE